jgi:hypothetical protein
MLRYNVKLYFGLGIKDVTTMVEKVHKKTMKNMERVEFFIRMFKKRLRGKIDCLNLKE